MGDITTVVIGVAREPDRSGRRHTGMTRKLTFLILVFGLALAACGDDEVDVATPRAGGDEVPASQCIDDNEDLLPEYVGLSLAEAEDRAADDGHTVRLVGEFTPGDDGPEGECFMVTLDLRDDRVNVELYDGKVIAAAIF